MPFDSFSAQWFPGHMAKARRRLAEISRLADFVVEVLDARAPIATHNPELEPLLGRRPRVVVLAKADLAEPAATARWTEHYRARAAGACALSASDAKSILRLKSELLGSLRGVHRPRRFAPPGVRMPWRPPALRGVVVGMPNTGKTTLIRALGGGRLAAGAKAGVTRSLQWVRLGEGLELCDTPGILWPRATKGLPALKLVWTGCIGDAAFDPVEAAQALAAWACLHRWQAFFDRYGIEKELAGSPADVLEHVARQRGHLGPEGRPDVHLAAVTVLKEFQRGSFGAVTLDRFEEIDE